LGRLRVGQYEVAVVTAVDVPAAVQEGGEEEVAAADGREDVPVATVRGGEDREGRRGVEVAEDAE
jgi:hypothetical protein